MTFLSYINACLPKTFHCTVMVLLNVPFVLQDRNGGKTYTFLRGTIDFFGGSAVLPDISETFLLTFNIRIFLWDISIMVPFEKSLTETLLSYEEYFPLSQLSKHQACFSFYRPEQKCNRIV